MKLKINYYLIRIAKENLVYLIFWLILILIALISIYVFVNKFDSLNQKISQVGNELVNLKKKAEFVSYKEEIIKEGIDLDQVNKIFTKLIPSQEDFFSIIYALEEISKKTNFLIIEYSINLQATTADKLTLTVEGKGDNEAFFNFLKDYRYIGGRLITIDKINYNASGFAQTTLDINFYTSKNLGLQSEPARLTKADKKIVKEIMAKVKLEIKPEEKNSSYPIKANPF